MMLAVWRTILETGSYDGREVSREVLEQVVRNFHAGVLRPMLRRGHHPAPGAPAAGWVLDLRLNGDKLEALLAPTPDLIEDVRAGRYAHLSPGFRQLPDGSFALDHVAVLGEEHPAWKGQAPLEFTEIPHTDPVFEDREPPLGTGERFRRLVAQLRARGAEDPEALAAWIGRRKYTKRRFQALAAAGLRRPLRASEDDGYVTLLEALLALVEAVLDGNDSDEVREALDEFEAAFEAFQQEETNMDVREFTERIVARLREIFASEREDLSKQITQIENTFTEQLKALREETERAQKEAERLRREARRRTIEAFVEELEREGRIPPALRRSGLIDFMESLSETPVEVTFQEGQTKRVEKVSQLDLFMQLLKQFPTVIRFAEFVHEDVLNQHSTQLSEERKKQLRQWMNLNVKGSA